MKKIVKFIFVAFLTVLSFSAITSCVKAQEEIESMDFPQLFRPVKVSMEPLSSSSFRVTWVGKAPLYTLEYSEDENFATGVTVVEGLTGTSYKIEGLRANTWYHVRMKSVSDNSDIESSGYSKTASQKTLE